MENYGRYRRSIHFQPYPMWEVMIDAGDPYYHLTTEYEETVYRIEVYRNLAPPSYQQRDETRGAFLMVYNLETKMWRTLVRERFTSEGPLQVCVEWMKAHLEEALMSEVL